MPSIKNLHHFPGHHLALPLDERVFNPSRETRSILRQAAAIGPQCSRLCELLFAIEGRVGQRKLRGIVGLARHYPAQCVEVASEQAMAQGVYSYKRVQALVERAMADAVTAMQAGSDAQPGVATQRPLTQQHSLIRDADEYADLFSQAAALKGELV